jgi:hypothetical protein
LNAQTVCRLILRRKVAGWRATLGIPAPRGGDYPLYEAPLEPQRQRALILRFRAQPQTFHDWLHIGLLAWRCEHCHQTCPWPTGLDACPGPPELVPAPAPGSRGDEPSPA